MPPMPKKKMSFRMRPSTYKEIQIGVKLKACVPNTVIKAFYV